MRLSIIRVPVHASGDLTIFLYRTLQNTSALRVDSAVVYSYYSRRENRVLEDKFPQVHIRKSLSTRCFSLNQEITGLISYEKITS
jgi:hypothetical protein